MTEQNEPTFTEPENPLPPVTIADLPKFLQAAVGRAGWQKLSPVQARAIPYMQAGRDMMVQAKTGSGKTGAFVLPILERVDPNKNTCQALILVPTRELAQQVAEEAKMLAGDSGMRTVAVYGGSAYGPQLAAFKAGAHLVVGTPGRVLDHLIKRNLRLDNLETLIFDEADRMMSMGFYPDMVRVQNFLPDHRPNSYMFSATFTAHVKSMAYQFLKSPGFLSLSRDQVHAENTEHIYYELPGMKKERALVRIIEYENPSQTIIFCNTKDQVFFVSRVLQRFGYNADQLSSDLSQGVREKVLQRVRDGKIRFLVATDVAARGLDIPDLSHVIQYEPPDDLEAYIHRAGRTGRAGASGKAILLITIPERKHITRLSAHFNIKFEQHPLPSDEDIQQLVTERLIQNLEGRLRSRDKLQTERMQRFTSFARHLAESDDGLALLTMLLDDAYHDWMHQPPELPPIGTKKDPHKSGGRRGGHDRGARRDKGNGGGQNRRRRGNRRG